ncbi:Hypothetical predicted protein [Octopus vulgaris]|uniref:Uncharacterized protein n=1 Tax=Octopus vulgaris TaxID=6645 RepID=A0AA36FH03_OCTVU|nr:Hypothetical predicted protein [Octopus vulgaris]
MGMVTSLDILAVQLPRKSICVINSLMVLENLQSLHGHLEDIWKNYVVERVVVVVEVVMLLLLLVVSDVDSCHGYWSITHAGGGDMHG